MKFIVKFVDIDEIDILDIIDTVDFDLNPPHLSPLNFLKKINYIDYISYTFIEMNFNLVDFHLDKVLFFSFDLEM